MPTWKNKPSERSQKVLKCHFVLVSVQTETQTNISSISLYHQPMTQIRLLLKQEIKIFNIMDLKITLIWCNMNDTQLPDVLLYKMNLYIIKLTEGCSLQHIWSTLSYSKLHSTYCSRKYYEMLNTELYVTLSLYYILYR